MAPNLTLKQIENYFLSSKTLPPIKLIPKFKRKYRIAILSNNQKNWPKKFITKSHITELKGIPFFNSAKIGFRKPHKNIYLYTLKRLRVHPKECVFIDDKPENIKPAKEIGIHTILYKQNFRQLKIRLVRLGIKL